MRLLLKAPTSASWRFFRTIKELTECRFGRANRITAAGILGYWIQLGNAQTEHHFPCTIIRNFLVNRYATIGIGASMIEGSVLVNGSASGPLRVSDTGLSFWGGVDPATGDVIDQHHPLLGANITGCVLAIPNGRGSCSGSGALLELILNDRAPAALVFSEAEDILTLGVLVAEALFERSLPILRVSHDDIEELQQATIATVHGNQLGLYQSISDVPDNRPIATVPADSAVALTTRDSEILTGKHGDAPAMAMEILLKIADIQDAQSLIDVTQAHIDACIYHGPSSLQFASELYRRGAKFAIPTTLNAISVDQRNWRRQGISKAVGQPASDLGNLYMNMGAQLSYTCAPYLLDTAPTFGEQIVWAESNAVMFANSVLGARTQKYPDFLDVFIALTGRAPASGSHLSRGRLPTIAIHIEPLANPDESLWPLLGYYIGLHASNDIPMITGLHHLHPNQDDLKAFSAAFATTGSSSMFHMDGITPEASAAMQSCEQQGLNQNLLTVTKYDLLTSYQELNTAIEAKVDVVCLGNPHFSVTECAKLVTLCHGRRKNPGVQVMVTLGRAVYDKANAQRSIAMLEKFGVQFITDTCWCMITDPLIPPTATTLMTNSGKYAHYGPALVKRGMHFGTLADCVDAACSGTHVAKAPNWLT